MTTQALTATDVGRWARLGSSLLHEFREVIPPTLFFFVGFNLILFTKRLFLEDYLIQYTGFFIATTGALIVGKVVLVADKMPFLRRFDHAPLAYPVLFKTLVYTALVFVARLLEAFIHYLIGGGVVGGGHFVEHMLGKFSWPHFISIQLWIFVLFLLYVTAHELNELFGDGELFKIFFIRRSSELKSTRRAPDPSVDPIGSVDGCPPALCAGEPRVRCAPRASGDSTLPCPRGRFTCGIAADLFPIDCRPGHPQPALRPHIRASSSAKCSSQV